MSRYPRTLLTIVSLCFFLSGFAALLYQTAWLRAFSVVFGTSELAVATILAVYMGGLAIGAAVAEPLVDKIRRPVLVYAILEAGIAAAALCVPLALDWAGTLYAALLGDQPMPPDARGIGQSMFYLAAGFVILIVPTGLMGATLPVLMRSVVGTDAEIGPRVALLYGINTAGAVAGAIIAGFLLLGTLGLSGTIWCGVIINVLIFIIAALSARAFPAGTPIASQAAHAEKVPSFFGTCIRPLLNDASSWRTAWVQKPAWVLPVMLISGANTFVYEVLWTRLLSHVTGSSIYAFATMLAAFLTGIAIGGGAAGKLTQTRERAASILVDVQIFIAVISMLVFIFLDLLLPPGKGLVFNAMLASAVLLPPAIGIGMTFPLAVRIMSTGPEMAAKSTARVYAWNTFGAIGGAILAGFLLIPGLGFEGTIRYAVIVNLSLALVVATCIAGRRREFVYSLLAVIVIVAVFVHPSRPDNILRGSSIRAQASQTGTDLYFGVGRSSTVRLTELEHNYRIRNNGLPEAQILPPGSPPFFVGWNLLTSLPVVAKPDAESMLIVGLGGGASLEKLPPTLREIHVVELEEEILKANQFVGPLRKDDPLRDPRITVVINDARNALRLTERKYDIIVSQPSQPWTPGASHLYTTEFAELAKSRLNEGGVLLQWMRANFLDESLLRTMTATLLEVYDHVRLYNPSDMELMFLASDSPLDLEKSAAAALSMPALAEHLPTLGITSSEDVLYSLLLDDSAARKFAEGAPLSNDNHNLMATESRYLFDGMTRAQLSELISDVDPLANPDFWSQLETSAIATDFFRLAYKMSQRDGFPSRLPGIAAAVADPNESRLISALHALTTGNPNKGIRELRTLLRVEPDNQEARYALLFSQLGPILSGNATDYLRQQTEQLTGVPAALLAALSRERINDWASVAALDAALAQSSKADAWYPDVIRIRAAWRLQPGLEEPAERAAEALRLLDSQFPLKADVRAAVLALRARAATLSGDDPAALESIVLIARIAQQYIDTAELNGARINRRQLANFAPELEIAASLLQEHPEWLQQARGPTVFEYFDRVRRNLQDKL